MRYLLALLLILSTMMGNTQSAKVIPGVYKYDIMNTDAFKVSNTGNSVAMKRGSYEFVLFDLPKATITLLDKSLLNISSDHRYFFTNASLEVRRDSYNKIRYAWEIKSVGIATDTVTRKIITDHRALDLDEKGNYIATKIWYDSSESYSIKGMKGLYKLDRTSGKVLQTLVNDTLFTCPDFKGCSSSALYLQKKYLAFAVRTYRDAIDVYGFDGQKKSTIPSHDYHTVYADSLVLFTVGDSTLDYRKITAFDVRSGQQIAQKRIDRSSYYGQSFYASGNKLYIFQLAWNKIEEYTPGKDGFVISKTWDIGPTLGLSKEQNWNFSVVKGPSFFVAPSTMTKSEAGGPASNTAHLLNGSTNKIALQVYPFYNRSAEDVAKYEKAKKASDDFLAKVQAEKDSIAHPEKYCHHFWNKGQWRKGITIFWGAAYHIMADYDCAKDQYKIWRPTQLYNGNGHYMEAQYVMVPGRQFRDGGNYSSAKQYITCTECEGDGTYEVTTYTTKTKELPWGYFSGIETKRISTSSKTTKMSCSKCLGNGVVLK